MLPMAVLEMRGENKWQKHCYLACIVFAIWFIKMLMFLLTGYFEGFKRTSFRVNAPRSPLGRVPFTDSPSGPHSVHVALAYPLPY